MFSRFKKGLEKTRNGIFGKIGNLFSKNIDEDTLEELEECLITADVGPGPASEIVEKIRNAKNTDPIEILIDEIYSRVNIEVEVPVASNGSPRVIMFVGVNGTGKTTSIGKLSSKLAKDGKRVVLAAADTFRAAASEQLALWAEKTGCDIVTSDAGADPASVAFDAIKAGVSREADYVLIDTAGRLQTRVNLMEELKKIKRVAAKALPGSPHEIWLVLDASIGQNSFSQVDLFNQAVDLTGLVLAKLDGTSRGGAVVAMSEKYKIPVRYIGLGEGTDDIEKFDPRQFAEAMVSN